VNGKKILEKKRDFKTILKKTWQSFRTSILILFAFLLVVAFAQALIPPESYKKVFTGNIFLDPLIGAILGSISIGNPIVSYVIGNGLLNSGVDLIAVSAFIISWVTVGFVQIPTEAAFFGKQFALIRTVTSFISAILIGIIIGYLL
jgi:uncharacterized membrane protein YraQ (UPF0718 family)